MQVPGLGLRCGCILFLGDGGHCSIRSMRLSLYQLLSSYLYIQIYTYVYIHISSHILIHIYICISVHTYR